MSLRVWLPLNGNLDNQGLENKNITKEGTGITTVDGKIGKCFQFPNNCASFIHMEGFNLQTGSWAAWIKVLGEGSAYTQRLMSEGRDSYNDGVEFYTSQNGTTLSFKAHKIILSTSIELNKWYHVVGTFGDNLIKLYIDGVLIKSGSYTEDMTYEYSNNRFVLGKMSFGYTGTGTYFPFNGCLNDVRIYDHALSPLEIKQISQGLILHYPLNRGGFGQENFILESHKVTSGGQGSGITRTYESDGSVKIVSTSGNGNYARLGFAQNSNTSVGNNMAVGDVYCISCDTKIESGTKLPTLFINSGNGYKQLKPVNGSIVIGKWMRVYYTSTWANPGTNYGNISLYLGFGDAIGTYYFKNFKLEKGSIPTPWSPASSDALATTMGLNDNVEYDVSGYCNNGTRTGTFSWTSDTPKYNVSTKFLANTIKNNIFNFTSNTWTVAFWYYYDTAPSAYQGFLCLSRNAGGDADKKLAAMPYSSYIWFKFENASLTVSSLKIKIWTHIVMTFDGTNGRVYENGVLKGTTSAASSIYTDCDDFVIGARANAANATVTACQLVGNMSDVRVYVTALSAEDVKDLYELGATIDTNGVLSTYEFTEQ